MPYVELFSLFTNRKGFLTRKIKVSIARMNLKISTDSGNRIKTRKISELSSMASKEVGEGAALKTL